MNEKIYLDLKNSNFDPNKQLITMERDESEQKIEKNTNIYSNEADFQIAKETLYAQITKALKITITKSIEMNAKYNLRLTLQDIVGQTEIFVVPYEELEKKAEEIIVDNESLFDRVVRLLIHKEVNPIELHKFINNEENKDKTFKEIIAEYESNKNSKIQHSDSSINISDDSEVEYSAEFNEINDEEPLEGQLEFDAESENINSDESALSEIQIKALTSETNSITEEPPKKRRGRRKKSDIENAEKVIPTAEAVTVKEETTENNESATVTKDAKIDIHESNETKEEPKTISEAEPQPVVVKMEEPIKPTIAVAKEIELTFTASGILNFVTDVCYEMQMTAKEIEKAKFTAKSKLSAMVTEMIMKL